MDHIYFWTSKNRSFAWVQWSFRKILPITFYLKIITWLESELSLLCVPGVDATLRKSVVEKENKKYIKERLIDS